MTEAVKSLFETGLERYQAGEGPDTLIPFFQDICDRAPKNGAAWSCLAWLYMLDNQPNKAHKAAQKSVKLEPNDPQNRVNLAMTMLEIGQPGVRQHVDAAKSVIAVSSELAHQVKENIEEGLSRNPDWDSLKRVKSWLFGD